MERVARRAVRGTTVRRTEIDRTIERALSHLRETQADDGAWHGDYGGPLFLLPMYVATCWGTGVELPREMRDDMVRYMRNTQNEDGGWGLHVESHSYLFTSSINYVAMRLCDVPADDPALARARSFLDEQGGPQRSNSWSKFLLALLNLYDYRGVPAVPPEMWLLPKGFALHPGKTWCQTRMVALGMSYLYGRRIQAPVTPLTIAIREELYPGGYGNVDWDAARDDVADIDAYAPLGAPARLMIRALQIHEGLVLAPLRERALAFVLEQIEAEDRHSNFVCLNPMVKCWHMWVWHHVRPDGPEWQGHLSRLHDYVWKAEDGTKIQGYHSSQLWDTAFAVQAMVATGERGRCGDIVERAHRFIDDNQVRQDIAERERWFRDPTKGGWGFSNKDNGWIVSDTTAEGLSAALAGAPWVEQPLARERLRDAAEYLLWAQTDNGGWASYEPTRGPRWLEKLNISSVFHDVMVDYTYVECTASTLVALSEYRRTYPDDLSETISRAIERGRAFLLSRQRPDGSFEGSWAICFTYGTWFGIKGLRAAGLPADHVAVARACNFLERHEHAEGGWGESPESCYRRRYVHSKHAHPVMTAWALLGLAAGGRADSAAARAGLRFLVEGQREDGGFDNPHITGVFNKTCAIHYENYPKVFPLWALAAVRAAQRARSLVAPAMESVVRA